MLSITVADFMKLNPCRSEEYIRERTGSKEEWTALEILRLEGFSASDKLWTVLREKLIDAAILHEFACRCAEKALALIKRPDPRSIAAIEAKRKWLKGEITDQELETARDEAYAAPGTAYAAAMAAAQAAEDAAAQAALIAPGTAYAAAMAAAQAAEDAAAQAAEDAARAEAQAAYYAEDAAQAAYYAAREDQVAMLTSLLEEVE